MEGAEVLPRYRTRNRQHGTPTRRMVNVDPLTSKNKVNKHTHFQFIDTRNTGVAPIQYIVKKSFTFLSLPEIDYSVKSAQLQLVSSSWTQTAG